MARLSSRTIATTTPFTTTTYLDGAGSHSTTTLLASLTNGSSPAYSYTYDANGNILMISEGATLKASYTYDTMNQLIREDSAYSSKSIDYTYDVGGNIVSRTEYNYTGGNRGSLIKVFNYGYSSTWKDQLSSYDGQSITYDAIGNPLNYRNGLSFTWANGRELAGVTNNGVTGTFTYNDSGIRTSKTYNGVITSYLLNGSSIVRQTQGESTIDFFYDENGNLYGFQKGTSTYYYLRNGQNDIVGILDSTGTQVVSYTYDAWGNQQPISGSLATTIGEENPFRYRGYYFDTETGLYYLNSRYYDSVTGRFINADNVVSGSGRNIKGYNLFTYCNNNPVNLVDTSGHWPNWIQSTLAIAGVVAVASILAVAVIAAAPAVAGLAYTACYAVGAWPVAAAAATAVNIGSLSIAGATIAIGVNDAIEIGTGVNNIGNLIGDNNYDTVKNVTYGAAYSIIMLADFAGYPSTSKKTTVDTDDQIDALKTASANPGMGRDLEIKMKDPRMPSWMGWVKYEKLIGKTKIHYVGHKYLPIYFDYKIK